tara:strand:- start:893 stop:1612 length:720 start_codon:yes stop_codon:yes gene_type:complete
MRNILAASLLMLSLTPAKAGFLDDVWGVITDPLKLDRGSENLIHTVERAALHFDRIRGNIDENVEAHLNRISEIIKETQQSFNESSADTFNRIDSTIEKINDLQKIIYRDTAQLVKCTTEVSLLQLRSALAKSLNDLGKRNPRLKFFGITIVSAEIEYQDINNPLESFREIKRLIQFELQSVGETDHPSKITDAYAEIQRLSDLTRCHYKDDSKIWSDLYEYELDYIRLQKYWVNVKPL